MSKSVKHIEIEKKALVPQLVEVHSHLCLEVSMEIVCVCVCVWL